MDLRLTSSVVTDHANYLRDRFLEAGMTKVYEDARGYGYEEPCDLDFDDWYEKYFGSSVVFGLRMPGWLSADEFRAIFDAELHSDYNAMRNARKETLDA